MKTSSTGRIHFHELKWLQHSATAVWQDRRCYLSVATCSSSALLPYTTMCCSPGDPAVLVEHTLHKHSFLRPMYKYFTKSHNIKIDPIKGTKYTNEVFMYLYRGYEHTWIETKESNSCFHFENWNINKA